MTFQEDFEKAFREATSLLIMPHYKTIIEIHNKNNLDRQKVKDAWIKFKRQLQYDGRAFACAKEFIDFEKELGINDI